MGSPDRLRTVAVVLAGGTGTRIGAGRPKQLLLVAGRTILEHTVERLHSCADIDEVLVIMAAHHVEEARRLVLGGRWPKVSGVLAGGADRTASTREALAALGTAECKVLFHDAVRPLVAQSTLTACVRALDEHEAVGVVLPSSDTLVRVDGDRIVEIPDRTALLRVQTPQGFRLSTVRRAYDLAAGDPAFVATDNCGVVLAYLPEVAIAAVTGTEENFKVTQPLDLLLLELLLERQPG